MHFKIVVCSADAFAFCSKPQHKVKQGWGSVGAGWAGRHCGAWARAGWVFVKMEYGSSGGVAELNP